MVTDDTNADPQIRAVAHAPQPAQEKIARAQGPSQRLARPAEIDALLGLPATEKSVQGVQSRGARGRGDARAVAAGDPALAGQVKTILPQLLAAKAESDRRNYSGKHAILKPLLAEAPADFVPDGSVLPGGYVGVTHTPTGFRFHLPGGMLPKTAADAHGETLTRLKLAADLTLWEDVPRQVRRLYKQAADIQRSLRRILKHLKPADPGYGQVFWHPEKKEVWAVLSDSDEQSNHQRWHNALRSVPGVQHVHTEAEAFPPDRDEWIRVKKASVLDAPYRAAGALTGGPTPLTNALVNTLIGGGVGYGAGWLGEQLLPEQYFERGKLRRTLGLAGAGLGLAKPAIDAYQNSRISADAGQPLGLRSWITPDRDIPIGPHENVWPDNLRRGMLHGQERQAAARYLLQEAVKDFVPPARLVKAAQDYSTGFEGSLRPIAVDAFNQAIWNDVHMGLNSARHNPYGTKDPWGDNTQSLHTPPMVGAAATGLIGGIQEMYGGASLLSPRHFISGLAAAGVDAATAKVAGGVLGVLGGLRPAAQQQLQRAGIWSGLIRGVASSVLGL